MMVILSVRVTNGRIPLLVKEGATADPLDGKFCSRAIIVYVQNFHCFLLHWHHHGTNIVHNFVKKSPFALLLWHSRDDLDCIQLQWIESKSNIFIITKCSISRPSKSNINQTCSCKATRVTTRLLGAGPHLRASALMMLGGNVLTRLCLSHPRKKIEVWSVPIGLEPSTSLKYCSPSPWAGIMCCLWWSSSLAKVTMDLIDLRSEAFVDLESVWGNPCLLLSRWLTNDHQ